ncbi:MAG: flagellar protein [Pseudomonadales bacterium]|nr:flagellar protein [Pseudomonadales bacterium]
MAEDKEKKELDIESEEGDAAEESGSPNSKKKLFLIVGAVLVLAGGGAGAFFLLGGEPEPVEELVEEEIEIPDEKAIYLELEPAFIINLPDRGRQRFLQATITVMSRNPSALLKVEEHMPAVRHNLSNLLSAQTIELIQSPGGLEQVRTEATDELNRILLEEYGSEAIESVLFTAFVMQ